MIIIIILIIITNIIFIIEIIFIIYFIMIKINHFKAYLAIYIYSQFTKNKLQYYIFYKTLAEKYSQVPKI